ESPFMLESAFSILTQRSNRRRFVNHPVRRAAIDVIMLRNSAQLAQALEVARSTQRGVAGKRCSCQGGDHRKDFHVFWNSAKKHEAQSVAGQHFAFVREFDTVNRVAVIANQEPSQMATFMNSRMGSASSVLETAVA